MRPIDADALLKRRRNFGKEYALDPVDKNIDDQLVDLKHVLNAPTLDYAPVRHGEWVQGEWATYPEGYVCNRCSTGYAIPYNYCPNCGAKMGE